MEKIFVFAGQGSQFYGMGKFLYQDNTHFKKYMDIVDCKIIDIYGKSIIDIMMNTKNTSVGLFDSLIESSFAIFAFEYSAAMMMIESGVNPDAVIGCSMGEIAAQVIADVLSLDDALKMIEKQSSLFNDLNYSKCCMIAVGGISEKDLDVQKYSNCEVISVSHDKQFVISGRYEDIKQIKKELNERNITFIELPVNIPFHTDNIEPCKKSFFNLLKELNFGERKPKCKMYSCVNAKEVVLVDDDYRWRVYREKINWRECISQIDERKSIFIDLSSDGELAISLKYLLKSNKNVYKISSIFSRKVEVTEIVNNIIESEVGNMKAFVFPGQGSQAKGMGAELFDEFPELVSIADRVLGYSIKDLCLNDTEGKLNNTLYTQPALFTVCALGYLKRIKDGESKPDYVAGHSIGEYAALFAGGIIDFETGIKLVKKRAELMARANGGTMAAVVGLNRKQVETVLIENHFDGIDIANLNTPSQIVISGIKEDIVKASEIFSNTSGCIMYKVLNVSGAFHSRYMMSAKAEFSEYLKQFDYHSMEIPVIANISARPYDENAVEDTLAKQLVSSVYWTDSVRYMMANGVESFEEIGPGRVAIGMVRKIQRETKPEDIEQVKQKIKQEIIETKNADLVKKENIFNKIHNEKVLGSREFLEDYKLKYTYIIGSMGNGISGVEILKSASESGLLAIAGTEGLPYREVEKLVLETRQFANEESSIGFNLCYDLSVRGREKELCDLYLKYGITVIEATGYSAITKSLVKYRLKGLKKDAQGKLVVKNNIIAKTSRSEVAECFMSPAPKRIVDALLLEREITEEEAALSQLIPMSNDICVEGDCGGYTDCSNLFAVLPAIKNLSFQIMKKYSYDKKLRVGASGGIGTGQAAAAVYLMGADFIMTGSVNQCTVESKTSDLSKDLMVGITAQDTGYINAWQEYDADKKVQVLKRGTLFKARADKLYNIYQNMNSIESLDEKTKNLIETRYFKKSFEEVFSEVKRNSINLKEIEEAEKNSKLKMKLIFKWYFENSIQWAMQGNVEHQSDFQIMCGAALGSFNQWVKGTELEEWRNRTVAAIANKIMNSAEECLKAFVEKEEVE